VGSIEKKVMFLSKYSLDRNNTIASLFRTQYTPDFLIAEYYGLRNTIFWGTKDLASGLQIITCFLNLLRDAALMAPFPIMPVKLSKLLSLSNRVG
jgi:hypothetical protein